MKDATLKLLIDGLLRLPDLRVAHHTDITVRINGQDRHFQADWLKSVQTDLLEPYRPKPHAGP